MEHSFVRDAVSVRENARTSQSTLFLEKNGGERGGTNGISFNRLWISGSDSIAQVPTGVIEDSLPHYQTFGHTMRNVVAHVFYITDVHT